MWTWRVVVFIFLSLPKTSPFVLWDFEIWDFRSGKKFVGVWPSGLLEPPLRGPAQCHPDDMWWFSEVAMMQGARSKMLGIISVKIFARLFWFVMIIMLHFCLFMVAGSRKELVGTNHGNLAEILVTNLLILLNLMYIRWYARLVQDLSTLGFTFKLYTFSLQGLVLLTEVALAGIPALRSTGCERNGC